MLFTTGGAKIFIGGARQDWIAQSIDEAEFAGEVWTQIGHAENLGKVGGEWGLDPVQVPNSADPDAPPFEAMAKVTRSATRMQLILGLAPTDPGQILLVAAYESVAAFAFKVEFPDAPAAGSNPRPSSRLFIALVVTMEDVLEVTNRVVGVASDLVLQSTIARIAASTGD